MVVRAGKTAKEEDERKREMLRSRWEGAEERRRIHEGGEGCGRGCKVRRGDVTREPHTGGGG